jgi:uncharacterized lipoprotein YmbA
MKRPLILLAALTLLTSGCSSLSQPYSQKELYALTLAPAAQTRPAPTTAAFQKPLRIRPVRVLAPYSTSDLYYKTKTGTFEADPYRAYVAPPEKLLTANLVDYLCAHGPAYALDPSSVADESMSLESQCTMLMGDYSTATPTARVAFRFQLLKPQGREIKPVWAKNYEKQVPLKSDNAQALIDALTEAISQAYADLSSDLAASGEFNQ